MEKNKILNIADNLLALKENHKYYIEFNDNGDFESSVKKKILYNNWVSILCNIYNSLFKYYEKSNPTNNYWEKVKLFVSKKYKYENIDFKLCDLLKKYRNKNTHSENPNSTENMLLPTVINDYELEELQILMIDVINYELEKCNINDIVNHIFKNGSTTIHYKRIINSMNEIMNKTSVEDKKILEMPFLFIINFFTALCDDTLLTEEFFINSYKDYIIVKDIITSDEFIKTLLNQPNGQVILDYFYKSCDPKYDNNPFEVLFELKKELENK